VDNRVRAALLAEPAGLLDGKPGDRR